MNKIASPGAEPVRLRRALFLGVTKITEHNAVSGAAMNISCGWILYKLGKYKEAAKDCNMAVKLSPSDPLAYGNQHHVHKALGNYIEALRDEQKYRILTNSP